MLIPATRGSQLIKDINTVLLSVSSYIFPDDFWFRRMLGEAEKLKSANRAEAHNVLGQLYGLAGDATEAMRHIDTSFRLHPDAAVACNKAVILSNLGYFSRAQEPFRSSCGPRDGQFTQRWRLGLCMGAFHTLAAYLDDAKLMQLEKLGEVDCALIEEAAAFLREISVTDEQLGSFLDTAGEMLREERIFFVEDGPDVSVWTEDAQEQHLLISFKLPVQVAKALALDEELGHRLYERHGDLPSGLLIHFESGKPVNEHISKRPSLAG
jgi:tetratricopeptide (TPR) repeat protein